MARKSSSINDAKDSKRSLSDIPLRFGDDPLLWASWLYYEEGLTQGEIASTMGVSRASVNAYLSDARARGLVNIAIDDAKFRSLSVSRALKDYFSLEDCLVVPSASNVSLFDTLGAAGARVLAYYAKSTDVIGVGWGRTILSVCKSVAPLKLQDVQIVQTLGSIPTDLDYGPEECATILATSLSAKRVHISAPAIVASPKARQVICEEGLIKEQLAELSKINRVIFGVSSLRKNSTIHNSGFFREPEMQHKHYYQAVAAVEGRFIDEFGNPVPGPLEERTIGINLAQLAGIEQRILVAGGVEKMQAILATLKGNYANILVTDVAAGVGMLAAEGQEALLKRREPDDTSQSRVVTRTKSKKFINHPNKLVDESLEGIVQTYPQYLQPINENMRALRAVRQQKPSKVGLVIGGGAGHDPCFYGYVGEGMADAVAIGNIFASPPPGPILECTRAASNGAGVLYLFGNYSGDIMNSEMAAEEAAAEGIEVRTVITTDDVASSNADDREGRRGVAGNILIYKVAGAACELLLPIEECERLARLANERTFSIGIALEPCSLPSTGEPTFAIAEDEMEFGVGVHGEPGVIRKKMRSADASADLMVDRILDEMPPQPGDKVALLVNSLGSTPLIELQTIARRVRQRLAAKEIIIHASWVGTYFSSIDMVGASISLMLLNDELTPLIDAPSKTIAFKNIN